MIPLRGVFDALGFEVGWDEDTQEITIEKTGYVLRFMIGNRNYTLNSRPLRLDLAPRINPAFNRTMIPLGGPLHEVGYGVEFHIHERTVFIDTRDLGAVTAAIDTNVDRLAFRRGIVVGGREIADMSNDGVIARLSTGDTTMTTANNTQPYENIAGEATNIMIKVIRDDNGQEGWIAARNQNRDFLVIRPASSHEAIDRVTIEMMGDFGWSVTAEEVIKINKMLNLYGITDIRSIRLFMATCGHESGKGSLALERLRADGTTMGNYEPKERGAGYIQLTGRDRHIRFLESVGDNFRDENTAVYIAENYPWEAAGWYWGRYPGNLGAALRSFEGMTLNEFVIERGESLSIFLLTQYAVQGWGASSWWHTSPAPGASVRTQIRDGQVSWQTEQNDRALRIGTSIFRTPGHWPDREKNYNDAQQAFK
jgi:hypothetical protein